MTGVYAVALALGIALLLVWMVLTVASISVGRRDGGRHAEPFGGWGRRVIAGLVGLGMAGMSATYAGWAGPVTLAAAVFGGVTLAIVTDWLAPRDI